MVPIPVADFTVARVADKLIITPHENSRFGIVSIWDVNQMKPKEKEKKFAGFIAGHELRGETLEVVVDNKLLHLRFSPAEGKSYDLIVPPAQ